MTNRPGLVGGFGGIAEQQSVVFAGQKFFDQLGVVEIPAGSTISEADIVLPSVMKGLPDVASLSIPGGARIVYYGVQVEGVLNLAAATGTVKVATGATVANDALKVETGAASGGVVPTEAVVNGQPLDAAAQGSAGTPFTLKVFATNGSDVASTMTAGPEGARILVRVAGYYPDNFPDALTFPQILPAYTDG